MVGPAEPEGWTPGTIRGDNSIVINYSKDIEPVDSNN
jgi:hypothetical protein